MADQAQNIVISVKGVSVGFGDHLGLGRLDLDVRSGEILGSVGASGPG